MYLCESQKRQETPQTSPGSEGKKCVSFRVVAPRNPLNHPVSPSNLRLGRARGAAHSTFLLSSFVSSFFSLPAGHRHHTGFAFHPEEDGKGTPGAAPSMRASFAAGDFPAPPGAPLRSEGDTNTECHRREVPKVAPRWEKKYPRPAQNSRTSLLPCYFPKSLWIPSWITPCDTSNVTKTSLGINPKPPP